VPLTERKYLYRTNTSWGLWHITETVEELYELLQPNDIDLSYLDKVVHEKKKKEFLASRLLIKQLLVYYELQYKGIIKDDILKPYLVGHKHHISISHSHDYASAVICPEHRTALDIELISHKLLDIAPKFLNTEEADFSLHNPLRTTLLWCAKETLYKIYHGRGLIFKENLFVRSFPTQDEGFMDTEIIVGSQSWKYSMHYLCRNNYGITFIDSQ
jgi:4'-phosphopantetheinyl transferase